MAEKLAGRTKLLYGVGDTSFSLTATIIGAYFAIFLTDVVGVVPGMAAVAIFLGRSWDYINDPVVGYLSDRTRTRWGRRRPFLVFGAVPFAIAFALLWWRPWWKNPLCLVIYYSAAYIVFDTANTLVEMPYNALTPELTGDYDERTALTTYRMFFSILAGLLAFTLPLLFVGGFHPERAPRFFTMGLIFGSFSALPLLLTFLGSKENRDFMEQTQPKFLPSLKAAAGNRPFVFSLLIFLVTWLSVDILQATLFYFIKYCMNLESRSGLIMGIIFGAAAVSLVFWNWLSQRLSKRWAYAIGVGFWAAVQIILVTLKPSPNIFLLLFLCSLAGVGLGAAHVLTWAMIPDSIEWDEWQTGARHEGMFYSFVILTKKVASSIAIPLALLFLETSGYKPNAIRQSSEAVLAIRILTGVIPAVL
ncbi:MAG TPA: MFS transporter, partial [Spirochaetia bacterium]|nr:MFS transporter [Spirochaetia bacterium]